MKVVALTHDLGDRARIGAAAPAARFVASVDALSSAAPGADVVVVDLTRPGALDALPGVVAAATRVVAYGPHVDAALLDAARSAGAVAVPRSRFFRDPGPFIDGKQS